MFRPRLKRISKEILKLSPEEERELYDMVRMLYVKEFGIARPSERPKEYR